MGRLRLSLYLLVFTVATIASAQTPDTSFLDLNSVEEIRLTVHPQDWAKLKATYQENTYYPAHFEWRGIRLANIGIRSRGRGSRSPVKPGLRLDFNRFVPSQRFQGLKSLVFENLAQDSPMVREFLSMALFRKSGLPASRAVFIRLLVNREDHGLHLALESVDKDYLSRYLQEDGGYLYEYSFIDRWGWTPRGPSAWHYVPSPFDPKTHEKEPQPERFVELLDTLMSAPHEDFAARLTPLLDLDQVVRHFAVETFLADMDGLAGDNGTNNFYFYRREDGRFQFLPWDKDAAFIDYERNIWQNVADNNILRKTLDIPRYRETFLNELARLVRLAESDEGWLARLAESTLEKTQPFALADPVKRISNEEYLLSVEHLRFFLKERLIQLRRQLEAEGLVLEP